MKKKELLICVVFLFAAVSGFMACNNNNEVSEIIDPSVLYDFYDSNITGSTDKKTSVDSLPKWIQDLVAEPEKHRDEIVEGLLGYNMRIYQLTWNNEVYYFIWEAGKSCPYCDALHHADGTIVKWQSVDEILKFKSECSSWVCIYSI